MPKTYPADYTNNFDKTKNYREMVWRDKQFVTGNDMNNAESMLEAKRIDLANALFNEGDLLDGGQPAIVTATGALSIAAGTIYINGEIYDFDEDTSLTIPAAKETEIGIFLDENVLGSVDDATIVDPGTGTVTSGTETQRRVKKTIAWGWKNVDGSADSGGTGTFYPVHLSSNRVLVIKNEAPTFGAIDTAIATYDRDSSGGYYVVNGLDVLFDEEANGDYVYSLRAGKCRINGFPISIASSILLNYTLDPDLSNVQNEAQTQTVSGGEATITPNNSPLSSVTSVLAKLRKTESVTRGVVANTADDVAEAGIYSIVGITSYTEGVDFQLSGGQVDWSLGGSEPGAGASYDVEYDFTKTIGIKTDSLTDTEFVIEDQDGGNEALLDGETALINYAYKLRRFDLLEMDEDGNVTRVKGIPHRSSPTKPISTPGKLKLVVIKLDWVNDPQIEQVSPITVPMGDLNKMQLQIQETKLLIAELAQAQKAQIIDGGVHTNLFIDVLVDDSQRSGEAGDDLAIATGMLCLPVTLEDDYPDNANNDALQTLDYTLENVIVQEKQTGQMKVNPYSTFPPPPKPIVVQQKINNNVVQFTQPFVNRGPQPPQPPIQPPSQPEIPVEQVAPTLAINRAGTSTTVAAPPSYEQAYAESLAYFQANRHNPKKNDLSKKQEKKVAVLTGNLQAGENVANVKINGKQVTVS